MAGRRISIECGTIWVCQCCTLTHANGECCGPDDEHGGDGVQPWATFDFARYHAWMGLARDEHADGCELDDECDCDRQEFSKSKCQGCGSWLAGYRHAFTVTRERQTFWSGYREHGERARLAVALQASVDRARAARASA